MSIERKYEEVPCTRKICTLEIRRCDTCESEIDIKEEYWTASATFNSGSEWIPSYDFEVYDLCCEDCVHEQLNKFLKTDKAVHFEVDKHNTEFTRF